ncbi:MAG: SpoIIE family protein phosphatase [Burkholderiaceae bacterium]
MNFICRLLLLCLYFGVAGSTLASDGNQILWINSETPITFIPKDQTRVLTDPKGTFTVAEVLARKNEFITASSIGFIDANFHYWIMQAIGNNLTQDREYRLEGPWLDIFTYVLRHDGSIQALKPAGFGHGYSPLSNIDPGLPGSALIPSKEALFYVKSGESLVLLSRVKSLPTFTRSLVPRVIDHAKFLEVRRFGLYIEGCLLGILFALGLFGWYSHLLNRDRTSLLYGIWITFAFFQVFSLYTQDGFHLSEFILNVDGIRVGELYLSNVLYSFPAYGQLVFFFLFASAFLQFARFFPNAQKFIYLCAVFFVLFFIHNILYRTNIQAKYYYLPNAILPLIICIIIFKCGLERYRAGMRIAMFFLIGAIPYFVFRLIFVWGLLGYPSIFSYLPESGISYLLQNNFVSQGIGLCGEAIIMALAVVSRNKWIQDELAATQESQKALIESQNLRLEATVTERTQELLEKHNALDEAHQNVVSSVNYASRLQRGQLPRPMRINGRFASFSAIWQPRDVIGGDVYWLSSSLHQGPFIVAVADCTGHGVPGAMLSLLVSNSLERIYAADTSQDPATALVSLDRYVRLGLNQDSPDSESDDGCDAAILRIDSQKKLIEYAGAKISLFQVTIDGTCTRHIPAKCSLGYRDTIDDTDKLMVKTIIFEPGDVFALVTDGMTDQPGGDSGRIAFGYRRLELLLQNHRIDDADTITEKICRSHAEWQGQQVRRDDLTLLVFKF